MGARAELALTGGPTAAGARPVAAPGECDCNGLDRMRRRSPVRWRDDLDTGGMDAMNPQTTLPQRRQPADVPLGRDEAALRRVSAHLHAEAAELPPDTWLAERLGIEINQWGERVLPELARLMASDRESGSPYSSVRVRSEGCPLTPPEESCLRRIAAVLRAEADELGTQSPLGARLDRLGITLWLECEAPDGAHRRRVVP